MISRDLVDKKGGIHDMNATIHTLVGIGTVLKVIFVSKTDESDICLGISMIVGISNIL